MLEIPGVLSPMEDDLCARQRGPHELASSRLEFKKALTAFTANGRSRVVRNPIVQGRSNDLNTSKNSSTVHRCSMRHSHNKLETAGNSAAQCSSIAREVSFNEGLRKSGSIRAASLKSG